MSASAASTISGLLSLVAAAVAIIFVLCPHEFAHAFVAYRCGDATAKMNGRMTLNPLRHMDPLGYVIFILTGFGWAKPVPVYPENFNHYRRGLFLTAIAGVVTNYIVAFIACPIALAIWTYALPLLEYHGFWWYVVYLVYLIFEYTFLYSLCIFVFNLLPFRPLDGFRIVESLTRGVNRVRRFLDTYGYYILIILIAESFVCRVVDGFVSFNVSQFDVLGYVSYFATDIVGWPISKLWELILI